LVLVDILDLSLLKEFGISYKWNGQGSLQKYKRRKYSPQYL